MALPIYDTIEAQGEYPAVNADQVGMADGTTLEQTAGEVKNLAAATAQRVVELGQQLNTLDVTPPVLPGAEIIEPERYYEFGAVDVLAVTLAEKNDGKAHEYMFEFIPTEGFQGPTITPEPQWLKPPQYPAGRRCVVSIVRGLAVMGCG